MIDIKTAKLSLKRQITIPKSFKILKSHDKVILETHKNYIKIIPEKFSKETYLNEKVLEENWNSKEDEKNYLHLKDLI